MCNSNKNIEEHLETGTASPRITLREVVTIPIARLEMPPKDGIQMKGKKDKNNVGKPRAATVPGSNRPTSQARPPIKRSIDSRIVLLSKPAITSPNNRRAHGMNRSRKLKQVAHGAAESPHACSKAVKKRKRASGEMSSRIFKKQRSSMESDANFDGHLFGVSGELMENMASQRNDCNRKGITKNRMPWEIDISGQKTQNSNRKAKVPVTVIDEEHSEEEPHDETPTSKSLVFRDTEDNYITEDAQDVDGEEEDPAAGRVLTRKFYSDLFKSAGKELMKETSGEESAGEERAVPISADQDNSRSSPTENDREGKESEEQLTPSKSDPTIRAGLDETQDVTLEHSSKEVLGGETEQVKRKTNDVLEEDRDRKNSLKMVSAPRASENDSEAENEDLNDEEYVASVEEEREERESVINIEDNSDFEGHDDPLLLLFRKQQQRKSISEAEELGFRSPKRIAMEKECGKPHNIKQNWLIQFDERPRSFYFGKEAALQDPLKRILTSGGKSKTVAYRGVQLNETNSHDMAYAHSNFFVGLRDAQGKENERYYQFKVAVGQLARAAMALGRLEPETMWRKGELFSLVSNKTLFEAFLEHFQNGGNYGTVNNKAILLCKFASIARSYFISNPMHQEQQRNVRLMEKIESLIRFLQQRSAMNKKMQRRTKSETKESEFLAETAKLITPADWDSFRVRSTFNLDGICRTLSSKFESDGSIDIPNKQKSAYVFFSGNEPALQKWCMNFLMLLVITGNGQRNQVYRMIRVPEVSELIETEGENDEEPSLPLTLKLVPNAVEKRPRDIQFPYLLFPSKISQYVRFHVDIVRPYLIRRLELRGGVDRNYLLLNTICGSPLTSKAIQRSVTKWIKNICPELHITPMDIRRSYCTYTIRRFVEGEAKGDNGARSWFTNMDSKAFIDIVASVMNTSVEQISKAYSACKHGDMRNVVMHLLDIV